MTIKKSYPSHFGPNFTVEASSKYYDYYEVLATYPPHPIAAMISIELEFNRMLRDVMDEGLGPFLEIF